MKKKYIIILVFLVLGFLILNKTLSELKEVPSVSYKSTVLDNDKKDPGSFSINNSAEWIGKDRAKITLDVEPVIKEKNKFKDIIIVIDVSGSMSGDRINKVKKDVKELLKLVLSSPENRVSLITFESSARMLIDFTNDLSKTVEIVDNLSAYGETNYNAALVKVGEILEDYKKNNDRELKTLFLTDGYPSVNTPNEVTVYKELKQKYPYMNINAIQYEMGKDIKNEIKVISDKQYSADMTDLNNVLFEAGTQALTYDNFIINNFLTKDFKGDASTLKVNQGIAKIEGNQLIWDLGSYKTGKEAKLEIEVDLIGHKKELYKVNNNIHIKSKLEGKIDELISKKTPILKGYYKVIYQANAPKDCIAKNIENNKYVRPFDKIKVVKGTARCDGYLFRGYELITETNYINDDYIQISNNDAVFKAVWTKTTINKSMQGTIKKSSILYDRIRESSNGIDLEVGINYKKQKSKFKIKWRRCIFV